MGMYRLVGNLGTAENGPRGTGRCRCDEEEAENCWLTLHIPTLPRACPSYALILGTRYSRLGARRTSDEDTAYEEHDPGMLALRTDFSVDVLRSDPPFRDTGAQGRPSAVTGNHVVPPIEPVQRFSNSRRYREPLQSHVLTAVPTYEKPFWYRRIRLHRNDARFRFDPDESFAIAMLPPLRFAKNR
jgi:hypothetical protein